MLRTGYHRDGLSESVARNAALRVLESPPNDLRQPGTEHAFLAGEVAKRHEVLELRLRAEIDASRAAMRRVEVTAMRLCPALALLIAPITFVLVNADAFFGTPTRDGWITVGVSVFIALVSMAFVVRYLVSGLDAWLAWRAVLRTFDEAITLQVGDALREVINDRWAEEGLWSSEFDAATAPTMVGVAIDNAVSSATYLELSTFIGEHSTSAIGLAGPRGIGKSTLMEQLGSDPQLNCIGVSIPAPRRYEPMSLVRLIHRAVAAKALGRSVAAESPRSLLARSSAVAAAVRALLVISAVVLWIYLWWTDAQGANDKAGDPGLRITGTTVFLLVAGGALLAVVGSALWHLLPRLFSMTTGPMVPSSRVEALARRELERLDYSAALQAKSSVGWKLGVINMTGEDQVSLTERQSTDADLIASLTSFLRNLRDRAGKQIVICIDELDKIDSSDDVVSMINGIKDLFHIAGVHIVVSVSTDAMHSFAARGVLVRDVFDSAFDAVVQVRRMSTEESREVLWRRATNFPAPAMLFCHAWSGGHPRDLIRAARACVTLRAELGQKLTLTQLADAVVLRDVIDLLEAAAGKLSDQQAYAKSDPAAAGGDNTGQQSDQDQIGDILVLRELLLESVGPLHERIRPLLAKGSLPVIDDLAGESSTLIRVLEPYMRYAACVSEFFGQDRTGSQWRSEATAETVRMLAQAQIALSRHPKEANRTVDRVELRLHPASANGASSTSVSQQHQPSRT